MNITKKFLILAFLSTPLWLIQQAYASYTNFSVPTAWSKLAPTIRTRVNQSSAKMKISQQEAISFIHFLTNFDTPAPMLEKSQIVLPKTTLELLLKIQQGKLNLTEAEKMAAYLTELVEKFRFQNIAAFDTNTSHIIGKEWYEINYSGEGMTWQKQRQKYLPYGITNFKTQENLKKFFPVESKLPYFKQIYRPVKSLKP